jgi:hypothetical protein
VKRGRTEDCRGRGTQFGRRGVLRSLQDARKQFVSIAEAIVDISSVKFLRCDSQYFAAVEVEIRAVE